MVYRAILMMAVAFVLAGCNNGEQMNYVNSADQAPATTQPLGGGNIEAQARDVIKSALRDENAMVRTNAVEVVAATKQSQLMDDVTDLLTDERVPVRFSALLAVGDMNYRRAKNKVESMFTDENQNVKMAVAYAMEKLGDGNYQELYKKWLKSPDQTVRANAALLLGKMGDKSAIPLLQSTLTDPQSTDQVRYQVVEAMAMLKDEKVYSKIWTMLISAFADVRVMGIRSMGALGTMQARNAMVTLLDDDVVEVRLAAAEQLAASGESTGDIVVIEYLQGKGTNAADSSNERAKMLAALAIGQIGTEHLTSYLPGLLKSQSKMVQLAAAKSVLILANKRTE